MKPDTTIDQVRLRGFELVEAICRSKGIELKRSGKEWRGNSPLRSDSNSDGFAVTDDGKWFDHVAEQGSDAIGLLCRVEGLPSNGSAFARETLPRALELLGMPAAPIQPVPRTADRTASADPCLELPELCLKPDPPAEAAAGPAKAVAQWVEGPSSIAELAKHYGLDASDFEAFGARLVPKRKFKEIEGKTGSGQDDGVVACVRYPVDGGGSKYKTLGRLDGKRKCTSAGSANWMPAGWAARHEGTHLVVAGGEEKAMAARRAGFSAVCWSHGEGSACKGAGSLREKAKAAGAKRITIAFDADDAGRRGAASLASALAGDFEVHVLQWPSDAAAGRDLNDLLAADGVEAVKESIEAAPDWKASWIPTPDDIGNAGLAARILKDKALFVPELGWHVLDRGRWRVDCKEVRVMGILQEQLPGRIKEIGAAEYNLDSKQFRAFCRSSSNRTRLRAALELSQSWPEVRATIDDFDRNGHELNCRNGVLDLRTLEHKPHSPSQRHRHMAGASFLPDAQAPRFEKFIHEITVGDSEMMAFLQRLAGMFLLGDASERKFFILHGVGANGKDTLLEALIHTMGSYATKVQSQLFVSQRLADSANAASPEVARLNGIRMACSSELPEGSKLDEARLKMLTGGDVLTARHLYQAPFDFHPTHTLVVSSNYLPKASADLALWDRCVVIPFLARFEGAAKDPRLKEALRKEADGILLWMAQGARAYLEHGLGPLPSAVVAASRAYRSDSDQIARWVAEACETGPHCRQSTADLHKAYAAWAREEGEDEISKKAFGIHLDRLGFRAARTGVARIRCGLQLLVSPAHEQQDWHR